MTIARQSALLRLPIAQGGVVVQGHCAGAFPKPRPLGPLGGRARRASDTASRVAGDFYALSSKASRPVALVAGLALVWLLAKALGTLVQLLAVGVAAYVAIGVMRR